MKRRRPATLAVAGNPAHTSRLVAAGLLGLLLVGAAALTAHGQTTTQPTPLPPKTDETGPTTPPPLSQQNSGRGVIHPQMGVDPGITRKTPSGETFPTPIIPPPGTPGGNQRVAPK